MLTRRDLVLGTGAATLGVACRRRDGGVVRVGFMTNLTHAPAIAGLSSGRIEKALGVRIEARTFRAGPRVLEALVGDAIDVGVSGPAPIVYTHARHAGLLRVLSGCSSGGASFVVGKRSGILGPQDLRGKILATTQVGTTQDISLRKYLRAHGYQPAERGGEVTVHALDATTILTEMSRGALDGAWLAEPWATRVVMEAGAVRLVDERDLWPGRTFPTALVIARNDFARQQAPLVPPLVAAMADEIDRAVRAPAGKEAARTAHRRGVALHRLHARPARRRARHNRRGRLGSRPRAPRFVPHALRLGTDSVKPSATLRRPP
jgi:NitT/TauT family transport system substrate-binding protein